MTALRLHAIVTHEMVEDTHGFDRATLERWMDADINAEGSVEHDDHQGEYCGNTLPTVAAVKQFGRGP